MAETSIGVTKEIRKKLLQLKLNLGNKTTSQVIEYLLNKYELDGLETDEPYNPEEDKEKLYEKKIILCRNKN